MQITIPVKLEPSPEQDLLLKATLHTCNQVANEISRVARERDVRSAYDLQQITYGDAKSAGLSAQAAVRTIAKVAGAYATHRANLRAGNYGEKDTPEYDRAAQKVLRFRKDSAQPYDKRILAWRHDQRAVSIWVIDNGTGAGKSGRIIVPFTGRAEHLAQLAELPIGESDLIYRDGQWYLHAAVTIAPEDLSFAPGAPTTERKWIGVDLGMNQMAVTSEGKFYSGKKTSSHRRRQLELRARLQAKKTKSARRLLKKRRRKEQRWMTDVNHCISKEIVAEAQRTGRGISLEKLTGIRLRVRHRASTRAAFHSWSFAELGGFISYKAQRSGVPCVQINPRHTSQRCYSCGHTDRRNRRGEKFTCRSCRRTAHADLNAARNIRNKAPQTWLALSS